MGAPIGNKNAAGPHTGKGKGRGYNRKSLKKLRSRENAARRYIRKNTPANIAKRLKNSYF